VLDNMQERALSGSTDWTPASIVLSVAKEARALYFGALLSRAGAVDLARLRFEEVGDEVPATVPPLPDEPQALKLRRSIKCMQFSAATPLPYPAKLHTVYGSALEAALKAALGTALEAALRAARPAARRGE
jgi:hypothetical protein